MYIRITPQLLASSQEHQNLGMYALLNGCGNKWDGEATTYYLDENGEMLVKQEHLPLLIVDGIQVINGTFFVEMTEAEYNSEVPDSFPESTYIERLTGRDRIQAKREARMNPRAIPTQIEPTVKKRVWSEYAPFSTKSIAGDKYLVKCIHVPYGGTYGTDLSNDEFLTWYRLFDSRILVKAEGIALSLSSEYTAA